MIILHIKHLKYKELCDFIEVNIMKNIFENTNEKLNKLIYEKLYERNACHEERLRVKHELALIKNNGDAAALLFLYELVKYMKKENIYFIARGLDYTSLYCSYLLGLLEYDPMVYNIMPYAYEQGSKTFYIEIQQSKKNKVINYLFRIFGNDRLFRMSYYNEKRKKRVIHVSGFLLIENSNVDFTKTEIDNQVVAKNHEEKNYKGDGYFVFYILGLVQLDEIQRVDANVDYKDFFEYSVYEFMSKVQITPAWACKEIINDRKPMSVKELAYCVHDIVNVNERNICHYVNHAILYYKLAKLRMLGLIDESYELKEIGINDRRSCKI